MPPGSAASAFSTTRRVPDPAGTLQEGKAPVAAETVPLLGLAKANAELVLDLQCRRPVKTATLDVDATVIHCDKRAANALTTAIAGTSRCWRCGPNRT